MNIKKEYRKKTIEYLEDISEKIFSKESILEEIELLKEHVNAYKDRDFTFSINSKHEYKTIDDLIITEETKLCVKETELDQVLKDERYLNIYLSRLNQEYRRIIEIRYLENNEKLNSFENIGEEMNISESTARRKHNLAIDKIAFYKYGEICKNNDDIEMTGKRQNDDGTMHDKVC